MGVTPRQRTASDRYVRGKHNTGILLWTTFYVSLTLKRNRHAGKSQSSLNGDFSIRTVVGVVHAADKQPTLLRVYCVGAARRAERHFPGSALKLTGGELILLDQVVQHWKYV